MRCYSCGTDASVAEAPRWPNLWPIHVVGEIFSLPEQRAPRRDGASFSEPWRIHVSQGTGGFPPDTGDRPLVITVHVLCPDGLTLEPGTRVRLAAAEAKSEVCQRWGGGAGVPFTSREYCTERVDTVSE